MRRSILLRKRFMTAICVLTLAVSVSGMYVFPETALAAGETSGSVPFTLAEDTNTGGMKGLWKDIAPEGAVKGSNTYQIQVNLTQKGVSKSGISWKSSNENVASVDSDGKVTGHKVGHADITVSYGTYSQKFGINVRIPADEPYTIQNHVLSYTSDLLGKRYHLSVSADRNVIWNGPVVSGTQDILTMTGATGGDEFYLAENAVCMFSTTSKEGLTNDYVLIPASAGTVQAVTDDPDKVLVSLRAPATLRVTTSQTTYASSVKAMDNFVMKVGEEVYLSQTVAPEEATVLPTWTYLELSDFWKDYTPGFDTDFNGTVSFDGKTIKARNPGIAHFAVSADASGGKTVTDDLTVQVVSADTKLFHDVRNTEKYYYAPVYWALNRGVASGTDENRFSPDRQVTRGQMVLFLWRAAGSPEPSCGENPFTDVTEQSPFYKAVLWAYENNITKGISDDAFGTGNPCTRAQIVSFIYQYAGAPEVAEDSSVKQFSDVAASDYFYRAVRFALANGITSGISSEKFGSEAACTRAQAVTFLYLLQNR